MSSKSVEGGGNWDTFVEVDTKTLYKDYVQDLLPTERQDHSAIAINQARVALEQLGINDLGERATHLDRVRGIRGLGEMNQLILMAAVVIIYNVGHAVKKSDLSLDNPIVRKTVDISVQKRQQDVISTEDLEDMATNIRIEILTYIIFLLSTNIPSSDTGVTPSDSIGDVVI